MQKFKQLLQYLTQQNLVAEENLTAFITDCSLQASGTKETENSLVAGYKTYQAVYTFYEYSGNADELLAHVICWVYENDQSDHNQENRPPNFDIEEVNDNAVDVMVEVELSEKITLQKDENGAFKFDGISYRLAEVQIDTALHIDLDVSVDNGWTHD